MKITKELLEHLKVKSITLLKDDKNILCFLERVENDLWTFSLSLKIELSTNENVSFQFLFEGEDTSSLLVSTVLDFGEDWINVKPVSADSTSLKHFLKYLILMEQKYDSFGRRKEERIKIGKENSKLFGLSDIQQEIFLQGVKFIQPCVVLDASVHGICVITPDTPAAKNEENFCVKLQFVKPERTVILKAHKVYSRINKTEQKTFITLSCQLLEPIHFEWRDRVIKMIEYSMDLN